MLDLLIQGGSVVSPHATVQCDVGIHDGRVVLLAAPHSIDLEAARIIDAHGKFVIPGGIDAHVHFNIALTPAMRAQSAKFGGRAAAFGGTTTFIDFAHQAGADSLIGAIERKQAELRSDQPDVDYALHAMVTGGATFEVLDQIPEAISGGVSSFKMFTTFSGAAASGSMFIDDGRIWGVMQQTAKHGGIAMVHCEDDCIIDFCVRKLYAEGRQHARHIHEARPGICEEAAVMRMLLLARRTGSPLYIVHVSSSETVEAIADARAKRWPVYGEALHNYLAFTNEDYAKPNGMIYHNYPALKGSGDQAALWQALRSGVVDVASSDDFTIPFARKIAGTEVDNASGGHNGIETRMAYLFSEGVKAGKLSINRFVDVASTAPARLFGLHPRKGIIAIGSDADIVVIDPDLKRRVTLAGLHSDCDYSLWDGWEFDGFPVLTVVRGQVLVEDGKWTGPEGTGQFIPRPLAVGTVMPNVTGARRSVGIAGAQLAYQHRAAAAGRRCDPVILLHPWFGCWQFWHRTVDALPEFETYAVDLYSLGEARNWQQFASPQGLARAVGMMMDALGIARCSVIGNSMGGIAAQILAAARPAQVGKLILVGTGARTTGVRPAFRHALDGWIAGEATRQVTERLVGSLIARRPEDRQEFEIFVGMVVNANKPFMASVLTHAFGLDLRPRLTEIAAATLVIRGERDAARTPAHVAELLAGIPDSTAAEIADAGHSPQVDSPQAFARLVRDFLLR